MANTRVQSPPVERIIISLPAELLKQLDEIAAKEGLARSALVRMVLLRYVRDRDGS